MDRGLEGGDIYRAPRLIRADQTGDLGEVARTLGGNDVDDIALDFFNPLDEYRALFLVHRSDFLRLAVVDNAFVVFFPSLVEQRAFSHNVRVGVEDDNFRFWLVLL